MKKEKITITILSIIILLLTSYIIYDYITIHNLKETEQKDETNNNENTNESTNNQENITNENQIDEKYQKILSKFAGKYQYGEIVEDMKCNENTPPDYIILTLKTDETYTYSSGMNCGSGHHSEGKYIITAGDNEEDNKIYLIDNKCHLTLYEDNTLFYPPYCTIITTLKFTYENDNIRIFEDTLNIWNEYTELKKAN